MYEDKDEENPDLNISKNKETLNVIELPTSNLENVSEEKVRIKKDVFDAQMEFNKLVNETVHNIKKQMEINFDEKLSVLREELKKEILSRHSNNNSQKLKRKSIKEKKKKKLKDVRKKRSIKRN